MTTVVYCVSAADHYVPTVPIIEGHSAHINNSDTLKLANEYRVTLPGHSTGKLQSLDASFLKPLNCYYMDDMGYGYVLILDVVGLNSK